jgi:hypothetical protein
LLKQAVCQGRFAVIDVCDDGEVANVLKVHVVWALPGECKCKKVNDVERKIYRVDGGKSIKTCKVKKRLAIGNWQSTFDASLYSNNHS